VSASIDTHTAATAARPGLWRRIVRVWPYFSGSRAGWALAIGATIAASATEPFVPALLKPLLDRGFQKARSTSGWCRCR
jgi:subfamily B ATP-binding cassette protein MsbA